MCELHDANCNGFGDIWWTDKCMYFSSIDVLSAFTRPILRMPINGSYGSLSDNRSRHEKVMVTSAVGSRKSWFPSYRTSPFCYTHDVIHLVQGGILG